MQIVGGFKNRLGFHWDRHQILKLLLQKMQIHYELSAFC